MTTQNFALLTQAALTVPKKGPTTAPKRLTSRTRPKLAAFRQVIPQRAVNSMIDAERKIRFDARRNHNPTSFKSDWESNSVFVFAGMANWPTQALFDALWTALSELWARGDVRRRTWPWEEDPLAFLIEANPQFWKDTLDEVEVERLMWPLLGSGPYPRAKFHRALTQALAGQDVPS